MANVLLDSLNLSNRIINIEETNNINFYPHVLGLIDSLLCKYLTKDYSLGIFFLENTSRILKSALKNSKPVKNYSIDKIIPKEFLTSDENYFEIKTKQDEFLYQNSFIVKLAIRKSVFGFCILSSKNKINKEIKDAFCSLISVLSYKIKDYELEEIFKIQLKAMQDAILEKDDAYEVIKKQHKKLQELDKAKNLFLANISHELRTPLNAIIGFSQALDTKIFGDLNEKQTEYVKDIQISSLHLLGMINEILDISKLEANAMRFNPIELSPKQVIEEVINILEPLFRNKNITPEFKNGFDGLIKADYQKFQQILYNLLSNAIKFTPEKGKIKVVSEIKNKNYILKVQDNGIGIEKKNHSKIFKKFIQLNNLYIKNQSSTGLGLTITKELVKLHNGKITLESELNKGSTFIMEFKNIVL